VIAAISDDQVAIITAFSWNFECISTITIAGVIDCAENVTFLTDAFFYLHTELEIGQGTSQTNQSIVDDG
jgi:hypothetical protein